MKLNPTDEELVKEFEELSGPLAYFCVSAGQLVPLIKVLYDRIRELEWKLEELKKKNL